MTTSIKAQLQNLKDKIVTTKSQHANESGDVINQGHNYNGKNSAYVWRIVRNNKLFNRFDVIETCTNKVQKSCLDLDDAQELVELHNQQVEKWWEVKTLQPANQYKQYKQQFHTV